MTITDTQVFEALELEAEDVTTFGGYMAADFYDYVSNVGQALHRLDEHFLFDFTCNADGEIDGGVVSIYVAPFVYVARHIESKHLTDNRDATGRVGVLAIKAALLDTYNELTTFITTHGLEVR